MDALPLFQEHAGGEESECHSVAAVPEREEMFRISLVRSDIGEAVRCHREQALPGIVDAQIGQSGKQRFKILAQLSRAFPERGSTSATGHDRTIFSSEEKTLIRSPT